MSDSEHKVGYKNPPKHTQFRKGQSGNPKGRPKNGRGLKTDLKAELISKMKIRVNGEDVSGTKQQLMLRTLSVRAASGDISATRILVHLVMQILGPEDHETGPKKLSQLDQEILDQLLMRQIPQDRGPAVIGGNDTSEETSTETAKGQEAVNEENKSKKSDMAGD